MTDCFNTKGFQVITSNRLEILAEHLAYTVRVPLSSPMAPEIIVVQSKGMERWVSMELASHNGICGNCLFPFPNTFMNQLFRKLIPDLPDRSIFDPSIMTFRIMDLLAGCIEQPEFEPLRTYLKDDRNGLKLFQLSEKIADTYDQYLVFRPEMISAWEKGKKNHWQASLWRKLILSGEMQHRARLREMLLETIRTQPSVSEMLPERISIFGISYLPIFHMQVFFELSRHLPVYLFLMSPCKEYWADIVSDREQLKIREKHKKWQTPKEDLHFETGNPLLASMGTMGRDFLSIISELDCLVHEVYEEPQPVSLLSAIQKDILNLIQHRSSRLSPNDSPLEADASIQIHSCHSPLREIEVLHDHLLEMFEETPGLLPKDILVMTPDIEQYAPFIQAVFGAQAEDSKRIPFSISDRNIHKESRIIDTFLSFLDFKNSRFEASRVMFVLECSEVREKFGISAPDLETIEHWVRDTRVRWGMDASHRSKLGLPGYSENTWLHGMERLLLGYALPGRNHRMFADILPYDHVEGRDGIVLGKLLKFLECLFDTVTRFERQKTIGAWSIMLHTLIEQFFLVNETVEMEVQAIRTLLNELSLTEELSGFHRPVSLEVIQSYLVHAFEKQGFGAGFITGGVTFSAMLPMRSIPFKIVCLLGMNADAFPRETWRPGFDFIAKYPRRGDRSRRNDDRYLFLEAILSARQTFYISYVGQSIQDNSRIPPSVLVNELMDYIEQGYGIRGTDLTIQHPLQAFSPTYFNGKASRLFSYSKENLLAAASLVESKDPVPFISRGLSEPSLPYQQAEMNQLIAFFTHPVRFLLQNRLGIFLEESDTNISERENFELDALQRHILGQELVERKLRGCDLKTLLPIYRASGSLPHGKVGEVLFNQMCLEAEAFVKRVEAYTCGSRHDPVEVTRDISDYSVHAILDQLYSSGLLYIRYANIRARDLISTWIQHLFLCLLDEDAVPKKSYTICKDAIWVFSPVENSRMILNDILALHREGLIKPLHFFPESSFEYAYSRLVRKRSRSQSLNIARNRWSGTDFRQGESEDLYLNCCFRNSDMIDEEFETISIQIFKPLLQHGDEMS